VGDSASAETVLNNFMGPLASALFTPTRNQCARLKYIAVAKGTAEILCSGRAVKQGVDVDEKCVIRADAALSKAWAEAESVSDCTRIGDVATGQAAIATLSSDLNTVLTRP
jgi:hypothetical protein